MTGTRSLDLSLPLQGPKQLRYPLGDVIASLMLLKKTQNNSLSGCSLFSNIKNLTLSSKEKANGYFLSSTFR